MVFSSLIYLLLFMPIVVGLTFVSKRLSWKNTILLLASIVFYAWGEPLWVYALIGLTFLVWLCATLMHRSAKKGFRVFWLSLAVLVPMAVLLYVKYAGFLLAPVLNVFGVSLPQVRMPLGISFFTFQIITYAVDVYRDDKLYQPSPLKLLLYVSCFPQLVAGPIVCYKDISEEIDNRRTTPDDFVAGMKRFICGLGKKVLLANVCGQVVEAVIANQSLYGLSVAGSWYMAVLYSLQIYFDFSGYSDMAIGLGRIFGFHYAENFNYPYVSTGISEFWRRWHISLGTFFREYVYIPLGGNRKGKLRQIFNLLVVWSLTGLWHGANINFVLWGLYYFVLIVLERFVFARLLKVIPGVLKGILTYAFVLVGWVIFYFTDSAQLGQYLAALFGAGGAVPLYTSELWMVVRQYSFLPVIAMLSAFPIKNLFSQNLQEKLQPLATLWLCLVFLLSLLMVVGQSYNPFIYFRF
ncbi:MAG: MBOAT family protein [Clostridiales bacterium]|nr:MBOAT family protein [Clostridiales bacterium]